MTTSDVTGTTEATSTSAEQPAQDPRVQSGSRGPILVGVDGSEGSLEALRWAGAMAERWGVELVAAQTWIYPWWSVLPVGDGLPSRPEMADRTAAALDAALDAAPEVAVDQRLVVVGPAATALNEAARDLGASLLVVGARGLGALPDIVLGSVSSACGRRPAVATAIVPHGSAPLEPTAHFRVGVDGSAGSLEALAWVAAAADEGDTVTATACWEPSAPVDAPYVLLVPAYWRALRDVVRRRLTDARDSVASSRSADKIELSVIRGDARSQLNRADHDVLVVGAPAHASKAAVGSVGNHLLHHLRHPLVLVPARADDEGADSPEVARL